MVNLDLEVFDHNHLDVDEPFRSLVGHFGVAGEPDQPGHS